MTSSLWYRLAGKRATLWLSTGDIVDCTVLIVDEDAMLVKTHHGGAAVINIKNVVKAVYYEDPG